MHKELVAEMVECLGALLGRAPVVVSWMELERRSSGRSSMSISPV